ncbi:unnamed protein product [Diamesa hyperborea]
MTKCMIAGFLSGIVLIALGFISGYMIFPPVVHEKIIESVELKHGTDQYNRWKEMPQPLDFKVYIFNVTNGDEVMVGLVPKLVEVGPFVYKQYRKKHNIRFSRDKERVTYIENERFEFDAEASYPLTEDDKLVVLNMHMNSILQIVDKQVRQTVSNMTRGFDRVLNNTPVVNIFKRILDRYASFQSILQLAEAETVSLMSIVNGQINNIFGPNTNSMFITTTPREYLFDGVEFCKNPIGVAGIVCRQVEDRNSTTIRRGENGSLKFAFFSHKNRTNDGQYEINTGIRKLDKLLKIEKWRHSRTLGMWKANKNGSPSTCQYINGTDATAASPFRQKGDSFYIFSSDICRSVQLFYDGETKFNGIPGYHYVTKQNFLNEIGPEYATDCFCVDKIKGALGREDGCLYSGALDLTDCIDAPVVITSPHFYEADQRYGLMVDGLNPSAEKHQIFMDIEPNTGYPLRGGKKIQFNMFIRKIERITLTDRLKTTLFPAIWVDEGIELNEDMSNMLKGDLINILKMLDIIQWVLVGVGAALSISMLIWFVLQKKKINPSTSVEPIYAVKGDYFNLI